MLTVLALSKFTLNMIIGCVIIGVFVIIAIIAFIIFFLGMKQDKEYKGEALPNQAVLMQMQEADRAASNSLEGISAKDIKRAVKKEQLKKADLRTRSLHEGRQKASSLPMPQIIGLNDASQSDPTPAPANTDTVSINEALPTPIDLNIDGGASDSVQSQSGQTSLPSFRTMPSTRGTGAQDALGAIDGLMSNNDDAASRVHRNPFG